MSLARRSVGLLQVGIPVIGDGQFVPGDTEFILHAAEFIGDNPVAVFFRLELLLDGYHLLADIGQIFLRRFADIITSDPDKKANKKGNETSCKQQFILHNIPLLRVRF